jgi:hypothetical protein
MVKPVSPVEERRRYVSERIEGAKVLFAPDWLPNVRKPRAPVAFPARPVPSVAALEPEWSLDELKQHLEQFHRWAPDCRFQLGFVNAASATRLVSVLAGQAPGGAAWWADDQVRTAIDAAGLEVVERRGFPLGDAIPLAAETADALRSLFTQLNGSRHPRVPRSSRACSRW